MEIKMFCVVLTIFYELVGLVCFDFHIGNQRRRQASLERFDNTCGERNLPAIFKYTNMRSEGTRLLMNSTITVKENISMHLFMTIRIERCKNMENLDTCEHFHDHKVDNLCAIVDSGAPLWRPLFAPYEPTLRCPVMKDVYRAINSSIDVADFLLFPMDNWYWRVKIELYDKDKNKLLTCMKAEAHIITK